jgi:Predicted membrane protein (DUF2142)
MLGAVVRERPLVTFIWAFVAMGLCIGAWSLATPLGAAPDEPEHLIQAAAVVRGQFDGPQVPVHYGTSLIGRMGTVRVPAWVTDIRDPRSIFDPPVCTTTSSCNISTPPGLSSTPTVTSATQFSNYPPLYYAIVGWPTLIATGTGALYSVRFLGVLLDSVLIALGLYLLARYHCRSVLVGALVALSPTALFVCSVANSNGMEIAAAFAAWCGGLCIVAPEEAPAPTPLVAWTALAFVTLVLTRPTSPANALLILAVLGVLCGWRRCRELANTLRPLGAVIIGAVAVSACFLLVFGAPSPIGIGEHPPLSLASGVWLTLRLMGGQLRQTIGDFGWLNLPAPTWVIVLWIVVVAVLVTRGLVVSPRLRRALPLLGVAIFACPFLFETPLLNTVGPGWQGRYWLPLAVGLPLAASTVRPPLRRAWVLVVSGVVFVAQLGAFWSALRAYNGLPVRPKSSVLWHPPGGAALTIAVFVVGQVLLVGLVWARRPEAAVRDEAREDLVGDYGDQSLSCTQGSSPTADPWSISPPG